MYINWTSCEQYTFLDTGVFSDEDSMEDAMLSPTEQFHQTLDQLPSTVLTDLANHSAKTSGDHYARDQNGRLITAPPVSVRSYLSNMTKRVT